MTNLQAALKWSRKRKRLRLFRLRHSMPKDTSGRLDRRRELERLLTNEAFEYIRHLKEGLR